ncbi:hypothetical protein CCHR01_17600 [Colletotrichum chrysophilum]|uniref:Uncharacterized protein n=1 Tax=Colletotrichum chrysophilum TaxID=1836956 RepID=A0AAD9E8Y3_9PEZI|nr:hypothetical protein CCHR01_17600 [Colletotrichum chrysophilum]
MTGLVVDDEEPPPDLNLSYYRAWWCSAAHISHPSRISATRYRTDCSCRYGGRCSSGALRHCGGRSVVPRLCVACGMQYAARWPQGAPHAFRIRWFNIVNANDTETEDGSKKGSPAAPHFAESSPRLRSSRVTMRCRGVCVGRGNRM